MLLSMKVLFEWILDFKGYSPDKFEECLKSAICIDTRDQKEFLEGHIAGTIFCSLSLNIALFMGSIIN
jgi:hypothetical protein